MAQLFTGNDHAKAYLKYRPTYPPGVAKEIADYVKASGGRFELALDVACGSGQSTIALATYFKKTIGLDISEAQIEHAPECEAVEFRVGSAENLEGFDSDSVDLITCAAGVHWLDRNKFYEEARRVLRNNGVICLYSYALPQLDIQEATDAFYKFRTVDLGPYHGEGWRHALEMYSRINLPFNDYHRVDNKHEIVRKMPISGLTGYIESYSPYQRLMKSHPTCNILQEFKERIEEIYCRVKGVSAEDIEITAKWPIFMLIARK